MKEEKVVFDKLIKEAKGNQDLQRRYVQITYLLDITSFLADMADAFMKDADVRMRNVFLVAKREEKLRHKKLAELVDKTRKMAEECYQKTFKVEDEEKHIWIEDRSHLLYQMMKLIVNRTTNDNEGLHEIYDAVKALPVKREIFDEKDL